MYTLATVLIVCTVLVILVPTEVAAFGAGDIPDFSYLNDKAFRHGDIENILETLAKTAGTAAGGGLLGFASSVLSNAKGGKKFGRMDIKRVYFGNWLRDYSQAMDIAGLSKLSADTIVMIVSILGFMTFGFATEEFEVTADRLAVYLPVEHIDNPKGYSEKEGDARKFHPRLRPPVDPRELEIDQRTGMKNYMATENKGWDTSTAHIRRTFEKCIEHGRRAQGHEGDDLWEAYRLLGTGLHTLEDLLAHSNWCEIALRKMGYEGVFCHVGDNVTIKTPNGRAPPLVTGTFGSADFIHSLMGEATDHISEASVTDLYDKMKQSSDGNSSMEGLKTILSKLPIGGGSDKVEEAENIEKKAYDFNPDKYAPKEVQEQLFSILKWRDQVYRDIVEKIEMIPGLDDLIDQLTNALNAYIYTVLAPWLTPVLQQATGVLGEGSKAVIDSDDQYAVFNDPNASDPSHSLVSKDHFGLILNEPAGKIAQKVVEYSVNLIVEAWFNDGNSNRVIDKILEAFHHPYYATGDSQIQNSMMDQMQRWIGGLGEDERRQTIEALTKESVRNGKNKRIGSGDHALDGSGASYTQDETAKMQNNAYGSKQTYSGVNRNIHRTTYSRRDEGNSYSQSEESYGSRQEESQYSSNPYSRRNESESYSQSQDSRGTFQEGKNYGGRERYDKYEPASSGRRDGGFGRESESYNSVGGNERRGHHRQHQQEQEELYQQPESGPVYGGYQPTYEQPGGYYERRGGLGAVKESTQEAVKSIVYPRFLEKMIADITGTHRVLRTIPVAEMSSVARATGEGEYDNEETFGAERLNLENQDDGYEGGRRRMDEYSGY
ncbi:Het-C-domain-containing protein [Phellopilus nigrolimitatus]|nr:Het-C-domain-containing protein [Phellopilus nigrolimitatus]